jgi:hypothetical protein
MIVDWLRRLRSGRAPAPLTITSRPEREETQERETLGDAISAGTAVRRFESIDLPAEFQARLVDTCRSDSNVAAVWLAWLCPRDAAPELLVNVLFDRPEEHAIQTFVDRGDALGGPKFVGAIMGRTPSAAPFYRRAVQGITVQ